MIVEVSEGEGEYLNHFSEKSDCMVWQTPLFSQSLLEQLSAKIHLHSFAAMKWCPNPDASTDMEVYFEQFYKVFDVEELTVDQIETSIDCIYIQYQGTEARSE